MLQVKDLHKHYEGQPLLCGVDFQVGAEETLCLLGQSGGGKSTILRIIAGLERAESGRVLWDGSDLAHVPAHLRKFGLMFQDYALFPHLNVFENVAFGLRVKELPQSEISQRVQEVLNIVGMDAFASRSVVDLSGGEKQRIAFARAIAPQPRMLMLDEPMGSLDRTLRDQLLQELKEMLAVADIPVIYVTHDQEEAFAIADRVLLLHDGRIGQAGPPQEVYVRPNSVWAASFFGLSNWLDGEVDALDPLTVKTGIGLVRVGCRGSGLRIGEVVRLLVRGAALDKSHAFNTFHAVVDEVRFMGRDYQVSMQVADTHTIAIQTNRGLDIGQQVQIFIDPASILCYRQGVLHEDC